MLTSMLTPIYRARLTMNDQPEVKDLDVLVSGGGTGIGAGIARCLVRGGAWVTICGRTEATLRDTAEGINEEAGREAVRWERADVTDEQDVVRTVEAAAAWHDGLDGVVANAGGGGALAPFHLQELSEFRRVLELNVIGTFLLAKHAVPRFARGRGGSFVAISSIAGHMTHPYFGAYTVSKAGVEELVHNLADEYGAAGIRFNAVRPGLTMSELMSFLTPDSPVYQSYDANTPLGGASEVHEVAELVSFLISARAVRITGQVINVDGGQCLRRGPDWSSFVVPPLGGPEVALGRRDPEPR